MKKVLLVGLFLFSRFGTAYADEACLYGTAEWKSGTKIDGSSRISTSWNDKEAYPRDGRYRLCLGSNPRQKITVYLDGDKYAEIYVSGDIRLDIIRD